MIFPNIIRGAFDTTEGDKAVAVVAADPPISFPLIFVGVSRPRYGAPPIATFKRGPFELTARREELRLENWPALSPDRPAVEEAIAMLEALGR